MPASAVKTPHDEKLWREAKAAAKAEGKEGNYAYVMGIFERMKKHQGGAKSPLQRAAQERLAQQKD